MAKNTSGKSDEEDKISDVQVVINLALSGGEYFHSPDGEAYATVPKRDEPAVAATYAVEGDAFEDWLINKACLHWRGERSPSLSDLRQAISVLKAGARLNGPKLDVHYRVAELDDKLYLFMNDENLRVVEITSEGWEVKAGSSSRSPRAFNAPPPAERPRFVSPAGMLELPEPTRGASVDSLREALPSLKNDQFVIVLGWILATLKSDGPKPILQIVGPQGSGKTTLARTLVSLLDPNSAPVTTMSRDERDLLISGRHRWILAFDNVSSITDRESDAFCRLATGTGLTTRHLYTNRNQVAFAMTRPVILTSIEEAFQRADLLDRTYTLILEPMKGTRRETEKAFWERFERTRPGLLGAVCDVAAAALAHRRTMDVPRELPRLADTAIWVTAAEPFLAWKPRTFIRTVMNNRRDATRSAVNAHPVTRQLHRLLDQNAELAETSSNLLERLNHSLPKHVVHDPDWPRSARQLSATLRRLATDLPQSGITVKFGRASTRNRDRLIYIKKTGRPGSGA